MNADGWDHDRESINHTLPLGNKMNNDQSEVTKAAFDVLVFQIKQLTKERDEARREICHTKNLVEHMNCLQKLTIARLTEDLRRMDAITDILYASIEKRKLREQPRWKSDPNIISPDELERCTMTEQDNIVTLTMTEGIASLIARLRKEESRCACVYIIDNTIETIERLVKERDEARREVCNWSVGVGLKATSQAVAEERYWDCYEKETT